VTLAELDWNADLGEGGPHDAELMAVVTSASVCCAAHAGDPGLTRRTLDLARLHNRRVGAHPGFFDRDHFGRRELVLSAAELAAQLHYQLGGLLALARGAGVVVAYLKPHGALYHQAARDESVARVVAAAAYLNALDLVGPPGSALEAAAARLRIRYWREGFADRAYRPDGTLVPRDQPGAVLTDPAEAAAQVARLVASGSIDTVCVHGDHPGAAAFARAVREQYTSIHV
jgi:UPF0271 protein